MLKIIIIKHEPLFMKNLKVTEENIHCEIKSINESIVNRILEFIEAFKDRGEYISNHVYLIDKTYRIVFSNQLLSDCYSDSGVTKGTRLLCDEINKYFRRYKPYH